MLTKGRQLYLRNREIERDKNIIYTFYDDLHYRRLNALHQIQNTVFSQNHGQQKNRSLNNACGFDGADFLRRDAHGYRSDDLTGIIVENQMTPSENCECARCHKKSYRDKIEGLFECYESIMDMAMMKDYEHKRPPKKPKPPPPKKGKEMTFFEKLKSKEPPHTRNLVRTNHVDRHKMYLQCWKANPPPGESDLEDFYKDFQKKQLDPFQIKPKRKCVIPNWYVPPHEKERKKLRNKVRVTLQDYKMPKHGFYLEF